MVAEVVHGEAEGRARHAIRVVGFMNLGGTVEELEGFGDVAHFGVRAGDGVADVSNRRVIWPHELQAGG